MSLFEKNKILEERIDDLVAELEKRGSLKDKNEMLKANISKEKLKRAKMDDEEEEWKNELFTLKLNTIRNLVIEKFVFCFVVVLVVFFSK